MLWLSGWLYRKSHTINPASGAGVGYQIRLTVLYGSGSDSGEAVYCGGLCRQDFADVRFTDDANTQLNYWVQSKTDGDHAVFWVKIDGNLESNAQTVYVYFGNSNASSVGSQTGTFIDVVDGAVGAWNFEDAEGNTISDYSGNANHGAASGTTVVSSPFYYGKNARQFSSSYVNLPNNAFSSLSNLTIVAKIKPTLSATHTVFGMKIGTDTNNVFIFDIQHANSDKVRFLQKVGSTSYDVYSNSGLTSGVIAQVSLRCGAGGMSLCVNGVIQTDTDATTSCFGSYSGTQQNMIGRLYYNGAYSNYFVGTIGGIYVFNSQLTQSQLSNLNSYYPDVTLETGKVLVRKYASTSQPSHGAWGGLEHFVDAQDTATLSERLLSDHATALTDATHAADVAPQCCKVLAVLDCLFSLEAARALKTLLLTENASLDDAVLALKNLHVDDFSGLAEASFLPQTLRVVLEGVCGQENLLVDRAFVVCDGVYLADVVEVGTGSRRSRLFLVLGSFSVQLTGN